MSVYQQDILQQMAQSYWKLLNIVK